MLFDCPECGLPCVVDWRHAYGTTGEPMEHVYLRCAARHWFLGPAASLGIPAVDAPAAVGDHHGVATGLCCREVELADGDAPG